MLLQKLNLAGNNMTNLPHNIEDLICLKELRLDDNEFEFIPVQVYWLEELEELGLSNNKISHISPEEIGEQCFSCFNN